MRPKIPRSRQPATKRWAARQGPSVWELDGPTPTFKMSKTLIAGMAVRRGGLLISWRPAAVAAKLLNSLLACFVDPGIHVLDADTVLIAVAHAEHFDPTENPRAAIYVGLMKSGDYDFERALVIAKWRI